MTGALSRPGVQALAALVSLFTLVYLLPDVLAHRLGMWVRTRARVDGFCSLTFDDGPDPVHTPLILDILKAHGCKATFFVLGNKADAYPDLMRRMAAEGHEIGIHGWDHRHPWLLGPLTATAMTRKALAVLRPYLGPRTAKFRPPWGYWSAWTLASTRGFRRVMWSLPGNDWVRGATPEFVAERVSEKTAAGSIVLLHDGGRYSGITAASLPRILDGLRERGLKQVTVGKMERTESRRDSYFRLTARRIQDRIEERFERERRLIPCGEDGLIRIELISHDGPEARLASGAVVKVGDPVVEIHLDSRKIAALYSLETPMRARVRMFRSTDAGFAWIATWLRDDPAGKKAAALSSTTLLDREMKHFGFEVQRLPLWPHILIGSYMQWLSFLYRAPGKAHREVAHVPLLKRLTPRRAWMSRQEFIDRYGSGADAATSRRR